MNLIMMIYAFLLFFILTPGVLLTLPPKGSKMIVAITHGVVFAVVWTLTHKIIWHATSSMEGARGRSRQERRAGRGASNETEKPKPKSYLPTASVFKAAQSSPSYKK